MSRLTYSVISAEDYPELLRENGISVTVHFKLLEHAKCHFCNSVIMNSVALKGPMQTHGILLRLNVFFEDLFLRPSDRMLNVSGKHAKCVFFSFLFEISNFTPEMRYT